MRELQTHETPLGSIQTNCEGFRFSSLDMLIFNDKEEVLVGFRRNSPARGRLFVPGGRIYKGENLRSALRCISKSETGVDLVRKTGFYTEFMTIFTERTHLANGV